ncbi:hypothetical protein L9F63_024519, partial [Diploptera punctata]
MALLRAHTCERLLLGLAERSMIVQGVLLLGNDCVIGRYNTDCPTLSDVDVPSLSSKIMDVLVEPLRKLQPDSAELACLKAIILFDPHDKSTCYI